jgi:hypothetical protein
MSFTDGFALGFWGTLGYVAAHLALAALGFLIIAVIVFVPMLLRRLGRNRNGMSPKPD